MKWLRYPVSMATLLLLAGPGCDGLGQECTEIGCADGVLFDILPEDGAWEDGSYALAVTLDDAEYACEFQIPEDLPESGTGSAIECGDLTVTLAKRVTCTQTGSGSSASQTCTPNPGEYDLLLSAYGTPTDSTLTLSLDGEPILSDVRTLDYDETFPNGDDCDPGCKQTRVVLEL